MKEMAPKPKVVTVSNKKPKISVFLPPNLFLIRALKGENKIYETEKTAKI